jgi:hypothetical protein
MAMPIISSRLHEPLNLALGEVLAGPVVGIWQPASGNCSFLVVGALVLDVAFIGIFPSDRLRLLL